MFQKVLIANRGEIACRIIRTCRRLGVRTVAVYSTADANSLHVQMADEAYCIGEPESRESYLNIKKIIKAAKDSKAQAIHPGYGFLSENDEFAEKLTQAKIIFIGPSPRVMNLLGDKIEAKKIAQKAKVPMVPSHLFKSTGADKVLAEAKAFAKKHGYPIMIKAAAGGGGRGMRRVRSQDELADNLAAAEREATAAFGDGRLFLEKLIERARHVEVQILGDEHGNVLSFFDRDCSMQRNHQKVIEEAPAPGIPDAVRKKMHEAARNLCKSAKYSNAGTVEFLLTPKNEFYFLEVNSRLQVEHPVTEAITGLDLVELQLRVASGEKLPSLVPKNLMPKGAAIECRLCAEIPEEGFIASNGKLEAFTLSTASDSAATVRVDSGFATGDTVSHYYDSLLAKIIVHAPTREEAVNGMIRTLGNASICGVRTNLGFLSTLTATPEFRSYSHFTDFARSVLPEAKELTEQAEFFAGMLVISRLTAPATTDPWTTNSAFRIFSRPAYRLSATVNGRKVQVAVEKREGGVFFIRGEMLEAEVQVRSSTPGRIEYSTPVCDCTARIFEGASAQWIMTPRGTYEVREFNPRLKTSAELAKQHSGEISSPLPGKIIVVKTKQGTAVSAGDALMVIESMKMEHIIRAPHDGEVRTLYVQAGQVVEANAVLVEVTPAR